MVCLSGASLVVYISQDLGSIELGKLTDLVVIDGNPLVDLCQSTNISYVMANGRTYDATTINEIGHSPRERSQFYWERPEVDDGFVWRD
ncbi:MAG: hypothetical protein OXH34_03575 [Bacteroidetes bacterium]|nr:hypothetical protein [Bacteroidota bacterium]